MRTTLGFGGSIGVLVALEPSGALGTVLEPFLPVNGNGGVCISKGWVALVVQRVQSEALPLSICEAVFELPVSNWLHGHEAL